MLGDDDGNLIQSRSSTVPKGIYMFGGVGCGKTMMMDLLAEAAQGKALKVMHLCSSGPLFPCSSMKVAACDD